MKIVIAGSSYPGRAGGTKGRREKLREEAGEPGFRPLRRWYE